MAIHLDFHIPNQPISSVTLNDSSLTAIPNVGDLIAGNGPPDYKIVYRRFDYFSGGQPPSGDVTILFECEVAD